MPCSPRRYLEQQSVRISPVSKIIGAALSLGIGWQAHAALVFTCTVGATPINFGAYNPLSGSGDAATGTVNVTCTATGTGSATVTGTLTLSTGDSGSYTPRYMVSGTHTARLQHLFDARLYADHRQRHRRYLRADRIGDGGRRAAVSGIPYAVRIHTRVAKCGARNLHGHHRRDGNVLRGYSASKGRTATRIGQG
jgi:hypothetical protein